MNQDLEIGSVNNALKSSLDPSTTNVVEEPEGQPEESSADYEADPADPDTIDPDLINTPGLRPDEDQETEEEVDTELDPEIPDPERPDADLPTSGEVIREGRDANVEAEITDIESDDEAVVDPDLKPYDESIEQPLGNAENYIPPEEL